MGDRGPTAWWETLKHDEPDVYARMWARIEMGADLKELHGQLEIAHYCSYSRFCKYIKQHMPASEDVAIAGHLVKAMLQGESDVPEILRFALTKMVAATQAKGVKASTLAALVREISRVQKLFVEFRRDKRDAELHRIKVKLQEANAKIASAARKGAGGKKVVDLETVTRLLKEADMSAVLPGSAS